MIRVDTAPFRRRLLAWYRRHRRDLPWRRTRDPYAIVLSELMLQQTQVATVVPYFQRFLERFPDLQTLAGAGAQSVLHAWSGLGYYRRARNLHLFAKKVMEEYDGNVPADPEELRKLPGVGPYTAAAVASIAFNQPFACVDGNVVRVIARLTCEPGDPAGRPARKRIEQWADRLLARKAPGDFNQALMELGATLCRPKSPACAECPVSRFCCACQRARQESYPCLAPRRSSIALEEWCGVVLRRGRVLLLQRPETSRWAGMWEFPHDRRRGNESVVTGLRRIVLRQCGLHIDRVMGAGLVRYTFTHHRFAMRWARCRCPRGAVHVVGHTRFRWLRIEELADFPLSSPHRRIAAALQQEAVG